MKSPEHVHISRIKIYIIVYLRINYLAHELVVLDAQYVLDFVAAVSFGSVRMVSVAANLIVTTESAAFVDSAWMELLGENMKSKSTIDTNVKMS